MIECNTYSFYHIYIILLIVVFISHAQNYRASIFFLPPYDKVHFSLLIHIYLQM